MRSLMHTLIKQSLICAGALIWGTPSGAQETISMTNQPFEQEGIIYEIVNSPADDALTARVVGMALGQSESLTEVNIPAEIRHDGLNYPVGIIGISALSYLNCLESVTLPPSIVLIEPNFRSCPQLTHVVLPEGLTSYADGLSGSFHHCGALKTLELPSTLDNCGTVFLVSCGVTTLSFKSGTSFSSGSVCDLPDLEMLRFDGTIGIWEDCFSGLTKLQELDISKTDLKEIPLGCFSSCEALSTVFLPYGSELTISDGAFLGNPALKSVYCPQTVPPVIVKSVGEGQPEFGGAPGTEGELDKENCIIYVPTESVETYKAAPGWSAFRNIIGYKFASAEKVESDVIHNTDLSEIFFDLNGRIVPAPTHGIFIRCQGSSRIKVAIP